MTASLPFDQPPPDQPADEGGQRHARDAAFADYHPNESPATTARRYRSSNYFLEDQLRTSEALNDFRLTKTIVQNMPQFSLRHQLEFAIRYATLGHASDGTQPT